MGPAVLAICLIISVICRYIEKKARLRQNIQAEAVRKSLEGDPLVKLIDDFATVIGWVDQGGFFLQTRSDRSPCRALSAFNTMKMFPQYIRSVLSNSVPDILAKDARLWSKTPYLAQLASSDLVETSFDELLALFESATATWVTERYPTDSLLTGRVRRLLQYHQQGPRDQYGRALLLLTLDAFAHFMCAGMKV